MMNNNLDDLLIATRAEAEHGMETFPNPDGLLAALMEEVGELARAMMSETRGRVRDEAAQVAALALRIAIEGDPTLDGIRARRDADRETGPMPIYEA